MFTNYVHEEIKTKITRYEMNVNQSNFTELRLRMIGVATQIYLDVTGQLLMPHVYSCTQVSKCIQTMITALVYKQHRMNSMYRSLILDLLCHHTYAFWVYHNTGMQTWQAAAWVVWCAATFHVWHAAHSSAGRETCEAQRRAVMGHWPEDVLHNLMNTSCWNTQLVKK